MRAPTRARLLGGLAACLGLAWGTPALGESLSLWNLAKPEFIAPNLEPGIIAQYPDHLGTLIGLVPPPLQYRQRFPPVSEGSAALRNFADSAFSFQHWDGETWAATTIDSGSWGTISCPGCDNRLTVSFDDGTQDRTEVFVGGSHLGVYWDESAGRWDLQAYDTVVQKLLYEQLNLSQ